MVRSVVGWSKATNWAPKPLLYNVMICSASWLVPINSGSQLCLRSDRGRGIPLCFWIKGMEGRGSVGPMVSHLGGLHRDICSHASYLHLYRTRLVPNHRLPSYTFVSRPCPLSRLPVLQVMGLFSGL